MPINCTTRVRNSGSRVLYVYLCLLSSVIVKNKTIIWRLKLQVDFLGFFLSIFILQAVAVGSTWAAVATNQDFLRIFTIGGLQTALVSLPGPVVCMSGHGTQLIVVYHNGMGLPGSQCLGVKLIDLDTNTQVIADQRLPLSPKANLSWLG